MFRLAHPMDHKVTYFWQFYFPFSWQTITVKTTSACFFDRYHVSRLFSTNKKENTVLSLPKLPSDWNAKVITLLYRDFNWANPVFLAKTFLTFDLLFIFLKNRTFKTEEIIMMPYFSPTYVEFISIIKLQNCSIIADPSWTGDNSIHI